MAKKSEPMTTKELLMALSSEETQPTAVTTVKKFNRIFAGELKSSRLYLTKDDVNALTVEKWMISNAVYRQMYSIPVNAIIQTIFYRAIQRFIYEYELDTYINEHVMPHSIGAWSDVRIYNIISKHLVLDAENYSLIVVDHTNTPAGVLHYHDYNPNVFTQMMILLGNTVMHEIDTIMSVCPASPYAGDSPADFVVRNLSSMLSENQQLVEAVDWYNTDADMPVGDRFAGEFLRAVDKPIMQAMVNILLSCGINRAMVDKVLANVSINAVYDVQPSGVKKVRQIGYDYIISCEKVLSGGMISAVLQFTCGDIIDLIRHQTHGGQVSSRTGTKLLKSLESLSAMFKTAGLEYILSGNMGEDEPAPVKKTAKPKAKKSSAAARKASTKTKK